MTAYSSFFKKTFIFKDISDDIVELLLKSIKIEEKSYQKDDAIYSPDDFERKIGFVYRGECLIGRHTGGGFVPLNSITAPDSFGIVTVFSDRGEFPTVVKAKNACTVLFFPAEDVTALIEKNPQISLNVIEFLTRKINFLNDKIATFSGGSVEEKLASYILALHKKHNSLQFDFNKKKSSEALNCGRASLYRAIDSFEKEGFITFENKKININDLKGLERILK